MRAAWTSWWSSADEARAGVRDRQSASPVVELFAQAVVLALQSFNLARLAISGARAVSSRGDRFVRSGFITQSVRNYSERYKYESVPHSTGLNCYLLRDPGTPPTLTEVAFFRELR